ncbi:MAG: hypothetical protein IKJ57_05560, partial [Oscillospiraceae bacterium]|nr:hypothetical protein [Oscillospiraceae bacterium]
MEKYSFCIAGGDLRSVYLAKALLKDGYKVSVFALDGTNLPEEIIHIEDVKELENYENIILPLPCCDREGLLKTSFLKERISVFEIIENMSSDSVLMGGIIPKDIASAAKEKGIEVFDYYHREEFAVRNAALTAEAAAAIVME